MRLPLKNIQIGRNSAEIWPFEHKMYLFFFRFFFIWRNATDSNHWVFHLDTLHRCCFALIVFFFIIPSSPSSSSTAVAAEASLYFLFYVCFWIFLLLLFVCLFFVCGAVERTKLRSKNRQCKQARRRRCNDYIFRSISHSQMHNYNIIMLENIYEICLNKRIP